MQGKKVKCALYGFFNNKLHIGALKKNTNYSYAFGKY